MKSWLSGLLAPVASTAFAQEINYAYPVRYFHVTMENQPAQMAYIDIIPAGTPS